MADVAEVQVGQAGSGAEDVVEYRMRLQYRGGTSEYRSVAGLSEALAERDACGYGVEVGFEERQGTDGEWREWRDKHGDFFYEVSERRLLRAGWAS